MQCTTCSSTYKQKPLQWKTTTTETFGRKESTSPWQPHNVHLQFLDRVQSNTNNQHENHATGQNCTWVMTTANMQYKWPACNKDRYKPVRNNAVTVLVNTFFKVTGSLGFSAFLVVSSSESSGSLSVPSVSDTIFFKDLAFLCFTALIIKVSRDCHLECFTISTNPRTRMWCRWIWLKTCHFGTPDPQRESFIRSPHAGCWSLILQDWRATIYKGFSKDKWTMADEDDQNDGYEEKVCQTPKLVELVDLFCVFCRLSL